MAQSSGSNTISQRIDLEGDDDVVRRLKTIEAAVLNLGKSQDELGGTVGAGFSALNTSTNEALTRISHVQSTVKPAAEALSGLGNVTDKLKNQVLDLSRGAFPSLERALGFGIIGVAVDKFAQLTSSAAKTVIEIDNLSKTTGLSSDAIQGMTESFEKAGVDGGLLVDMLNKFSQKMGDARAKSLDLTGAMNGNVTVFKGVKEGADAVGNSVSVLKGKMDAASMGNQLTGLTSVLRGGQQPAKLDLANFDKVFQFVTGLKRQNYADTMEGNQKANEDFLKGLVRLHNVDTQLANAIGAATFGRKWKQEYAGVEALIKSGGIEKAVHELSEKGLLISPEDRQAAREYRAATVELDTAWQSFGRITLPMASRGLTNMSTNLENSMKAAPAFKEMMSSLFSTIGRGDISGLARGFKAMDKEFFGIDDDAILQSIRDHFGKLGSIATEAFKGNFKPLLSEINVAGDNVSAFLDKLLGPNFAGRVSAKIGDAFKNASDEIPDLVDMLKTDFQSFTDWFSKALSDVWAGFKNTGSDALGWLSDKVGSLLAKFGSAFGGSGAAGVGSEGAAVFPSIPDYSNALGASSLAFAGGGHVPGYGFGDRVRAMLEPGEFVIRRSVVDMLGADFFAAINGGMGELGPRRGFATGGMVYPTWIGPSQTAPGSVVQFWLGGDRFDLSAEDETVSRLERKASSERTLRTGRYPGWYPGGAR